MNKQSFGIFLMHHDYLKALEIYRNSPEDMVPQIMDQLATYMPDAIIIEGLEYTEQLFFEILDFKAFRNFKFTSFKIKVLL